MPLDLEFDETEKMLCFLLLVLLACTSLGTTTLVRIKKQMRIMTRILITCFFMNSYVFHSSSWNKMCFLHHHVLFIKELLLYFLNFDGIENQMQKISAILSHWDQMIQVTIMITWTVSLMMILMCLNQVAYICIDIHVLTYKVISAYLIHDQQNMMSGIFGR